MPKLLTDDQAISLEWLTRRGRAIAGPLLQINEHDVNDAIQQTRIEVLVSMPPCESRGHAINWTKRTLINKCFDIIRDKKQTTPNTEEVNRVLDDGRSVPSSYEGPFIEAYAATAVAHRMRLLRLHERLKKPGTWAEFFADSYTRPSCLTDLFLCSLHNSVDLSWLTRVQSQKSDAVRNRLKRTTHRLNSHLSLALSMPPGDDEEEHAFIWVVDHIWYGVFGPAPPDVLREAHTKIDEALRDAERVIKAFAVTNGH